jgi:hypothetical protein
MRPNPAQVLSLPLLLVSLFGGSGCNSYREERLVDTAFEVAAASTASSAHERQVAEAREEREAIEGRRAYAEAAATAAAKDPEGCTEVRVVSVPSAAPGATPPRAVDCKGHVLVQDEQGHWRDYDAARGPEAAKR